MKRLIFILGVSLVVLLMAASVYAESAYVVQPGDTLFRIALRFGVSQEAILAANGLANPNLIYTGQRLVIPEAGAALTVSTATPAPAASVAAPAPAAGSNTYRVKRGDTLWAISRRNGTTVAAIMAANGMTSPIIYINQVLIIPGPATATPVATPTAAGAPAAAPAASGVYMSRSIRGDYFTLDTNRIGVGQKIWFDFKVTNTGGDQDFGLLSVHSDYGINGLSWSNSTLRGGQSLEWHDHLQIGTPGNYPFYLAICYADKDTCKSNQAPWERLSQTMWVTVVDEAGSYTGYTTSEGIVGNYFFVENMTSHQGEQIWFNFKVTNTGGSIGYGILSAQVRGVKPGLSWTGATLNGGQELEWHDHLDSLAPGTYAMFLGICFDNVDACKNNLSLWKRLSDDVYLTVLPPR